VPWSKSYASRALIEIILIILMYIAPLAIATRLYLSFVGSSAVYEWFTYLLIGLLALGVVAIVLVLVNSIAYIEVSSMGIRMVRGFVGKREVLVSRGEVSEVGLQAEKFTWLYPLLAGKSSALVLASAGAATVTIKTAYGRKWRFVLDAKDILAFAKTVEEELAIKVAT